MLTGGLRVGVSARLAKTALAAMGGRSLDAIEEVWHGLEAPYRSLFQWLDGTGPRPDITGIPVFRSPMLANPLEDGVLDTLDIRDLAVEWKWDGIRVQIASGRGVTKLYSRTGDDIGRSFPDIVAPLSFDGVVDGELLVLRDGVVAPFNDLQQRLNRKSVTAKLIARASRSRPPLRRPLSRRRRLARMRFRHTPSPTRKMVRSPSPAVRRSLRNPHLPRPRRP